MTGEAAIQAGVVVVVLVVSVLVGRVVVGTLLRRVEPGPAHTGVLRGGTWIGMLERLAITGAVLAGYPEATAVVLAVKGLGRYPELREAHPDKRSPAAERFIIGTLASYVWAGGSAVLGALVLRAVS
ncbi:hypothetical protein MF406_09315 [Georgenia sp. TF02-10]|uniref:hypothetical protein n=1 Tax=Georgenia sp. TF02-10 TaxID=2917725 RepID=UPI001FA7AC4B|nr:hypothetical protein [Georgenia sp. TF02-10]UNX53230.1 hypothetical protein MF406_09315 [Georgenia sp. TF02-10]